MKSATGCPDDALFADDILMRYPTLKGARVWKREHDLILLRAVLKYVLIFFFFIPVRIMVSAFGLILCMEFSKINSCVK